MVDVQQVKAIIRCILDSQEFDGKGELLNQIDSIEVTGEATFLKLAPNKSLPSSSFSSAGPIPGNHWVVDGHGKEIGTLLLWVEDGYLTELEFAWVTDEPPMSLPQIEQIVSKNV